MIKILIQIKDNKLQIQEKKRLSTDQKTLINTNVISQNELVFSDEYILENKNIIHNFLKELIVTYNINTLIIRESKIAVIILQVLSNINALKYLYLLEETNLTYKICSAIIKTNSIKYISVYSIPTYLFEILDKEKIKVDSRNEILFLSKFMQDNNLENFSSIYYKTKINLNFPLSKEDEEDFLSFININKYLKIIYINNVNKNDIENIIEILNKLKLKNIKIIIEQDINNIEIIEYLKKINKKNVKNNIKFEIDYSKKYLQDNIMGQIHINTIRTCILITLIFISTIVFYVFYSNYISMQNVKNIQDEIFETIANNTDSIDNETPDNEENIEENNDNKPETPKTEINRDLASLMEINNDTVGWLKVNNTKIDYPVVQAADNDYYLTNNFKKQKDNSGWIFMDYRADPVNLSQNTIIFGHNMYYSAIMFGTLYKVKNPVWYKNKENQIIEFNTLYENLKWQIFSIYVIPNTNDYLIADFSTEEKYQDFLTMITNRSIYTFNTPVSTNDKILTLSTCSNNGKNRLVVHAVLLK